MLRFGLLVAGINLLDGFQDIGAFFRESVGHLHETASAMRVTVGQQRRGRAGHIAVEPVAHLDRSVQSDRTSIEQRLKVFSGMPPSTEEEGQGVFALFHHDAGGKHTGAGIAFVGRPILVLANLLLDGQDFDRGVVIEEDFAVGGVALKSWPHAAHRNFSSSKTVPAMIGCA